jgi:photosystem II stability/assembly factor-like uncharacterized protein
MSLHPSRFQQLLIARLCFAICQTLSSISLCQDVAVLGSSEATADKEAMTDVKSTFLAWRKLETEPYRGKQDDIYFVNENVGWYVNGAGKIFRTQDGGTTWQLQLDQPGTFFRCVAFIDDQRGFAGNIGPGYFPGVTDDAPLYETVDGGETWKAVTTIEGVRRQLEVHFSDN